MAQGTKGSPASKATTFSFRQVPYSLPPMEAAELMMLQPDDLLAKLSDCNAHLPPKNASLEFISAAFHVLIRRIRGGQRDPKWRQVQFQWRVDFGAYKSRWKKRSTKRPKVQPNAQACHEDNVVIDSQNWCLSKRYNRNFRSLGFHNFGKNFISMNQNHPREELTAEVLMQAYDVYVDRAPNISSEVRQEMKQRKTSKRARTFLAECGILAAAATTRAEREGAACSPGSSNGDSKMETDGAEIRDAAESSAEDTEDDMQDVLPATVSPPAGKHIEDEGEGWNPVRSSSEDDDGTSSTTTRSGSESGAQEVIDEQIQSDGFSGGANYDRMSIDDDREDDKSWSRKRRHESTPPPSTHDNTWSHPTHPPRAKRLRTAKSPTPTGSPSHAEKYGQGRDIFSALMDYLDQFR